MRPIRVVVADLQGGDGGKGRVIDDFITQALERDDGKRILNPVAQGGDNAGHTGYVELESGLLVPFVTHAAPIGLASNVDV